jgi:membrane protease YdiL (CAAX protease family)
MCKHGAFRCFFVESAVAFMNRGPSMESPWISLMYVVVALMVVRMLYRDYLRFRTTGVIAPQALPGATPAPFGLMVVGVIGSILILSVEIRGEYALNLVGEQSMLQWYAIFPILCAPIIEEIIFRGYLVISHRGKKILWCSIIGFSLLFALIHGHLITFGGEGEPWLKWQGNQLKGWFTTSILMAQSLWWYTLRFCRWNPHQSLLPSMLAHFAVNVGVLLTKGFQGYLEW